MSLGLQYGKIKTIFHDHMVQSSDESNWNMPILSVTFHIIIFDFTKLIFTWPRKCSTHDYYHYIVTKQILARQHQKVYKYTHEVKWALGMVRRNCAIYIACRHRQQLFIVCCYGPSSKFSLIINLNDFWVSHANYLFILFTSKNDIFVGYFSLFFAAPWLSLEAC
jgi:hypothetical protein